MAAGVVLVERKAELAEVQSVLHGGGRAVVVTGPAGVGKSRLLREAVGEHAIPTALASPVAPVPFGVISDLLPGHRLGPGNRASTIRRCVTALRRLPHPAVMIEDLHWADADSLAVAVDLARSSDGPVLLASTRDEPHRPLVDALATVAGSPGVTVLHLRGLSTGGVATLIETVWGRPVSVRAAIQVRQRTDGLPYWVEELARSASTPAELARVGLPGMASAALCARVDAAGPAARRVAEVAAVLGERVDLDLLAAVLAEPAGAVVPLLRELVDAWLLVEVAPDQFAFRHALTSEAVAGRVPGALRRGWRARAYRRLRSAGAGEQVLAWHAAGAGLQAETARVAPNAAAAVLAAGSGAEALRLAELALSAGASPTWPVHALAARAAYSAGWFDEAERHALAWRDGAETAGDVSSAAEADCRLASLRWRAGDLAGQWAVLEAALARPGLAGPALAQVRAARANALHRAERLAEAVTEADRVLRLAEQLGAPAARRSALVDKGTALSGNRGLASKVADPTRQSALRNEGIALLARAEQESLEAGDRIALGRILNNRLMIPLPDGTAPEYWARWEATYRRATTLGLHPSLGKIVGHAVDLAEWTGHWQRGWQAATTRLAEETDAVERVILAARAALLALEADRLDDAVRLAGRSTAGASGMDHFRALLYANLIGIALAARTGTPALAIRALRRYRLGVAPQAHATWPHQAWEAARWALVGGAGTGSVHAFLAAAVPAGLPDRDADDAQLSLASDHERAIQAGERLLERELPAVRRADALTRLGSRQLRLGRRAPAAAHAAEACALLANWPGFRLAAARKLARAAAGAAPALTTREREVRELVATGASNQQIAARLGISPRTVAVHVSRLLAKTGCASRTELAIQVLRAAQAPTDGDPDLPHPDGILAIARIDLR
jgi:DNA-binding CsgD family transcriptional regulator